MRKITHTCACTHARAHGTKRDEVTNRGNFVCACAHTCMCVCKMRNFLFHITQQVLAG